MASDLLAKISGEVKQRLGELRPLVSEYERLLAAERSLKDMDGVPSGSAQTTEAPSRRQAKERRGSPGAVVQRAASKPSGRKRQPVAVSTVGQAVLDALEHGSHTVSELVMVTAMSAAEIRKNVRGLLSAKKIEKTDRDGKTAYALASTVTG